MAFFEKIDIDKTLKSQRIVFKSNWLELADNALFYLAAVFFIICNLLIYNEVDFKSGNDKVIGYFFMPAGILFAVILIYKKINERNLIGLQTPFDKKTNRKVILEYVKNEGWKLEVNNANYLQAKTGFDQAHWGYFVTVIFQNNLIYLNVLSDNPKLRMPILLKQNSIKREIKNKISDFPIITV